MAAGNGVWAKTGKSGAKGTVFYRATTVALAAAQLGVTGADLRVQARSGDVPTLDALADAVAAQQQAPALLKQLQGLFQKPAPPPTAQPTLAAMLAAAGGTVDGLTQQLRTLVPEATALPGFDQKTFDHAAGMYDPVTRRVVMDTDVAGFLTLLAEGKITTADSPYTITAVHTYIHELLHSASPPVRRKPPDYDPFYEEGLTEWRAWKITTALTGGPPPNDGYQRLRLAFTWLAGEVGDAAMQTLWDAPTSIERRVVLESLLAKRFGRSFPNVPQRWTWAELFESQNGIATLTRLAQEQL